MMSGQSCTGKCLFFLRQATDKAISNNNIANDVLFMWMDCSSGKLLQSFENMMSKIMVPALKSQEVSLQFAWTSSDPVITNTTAGITELYMLWKD
jgi:hypothetical protein